MFIIFFLPLLKRSNHSKMPRWLSVTERVEILELYENRSAQETADIFNRRHPERAQPLNKGTVVRLKSKLKVTGSLHNRHIPGRPSIVQNQQKVKE